MTKYTLAALAAILVLSACSDGTAVPISGGGGGGGVTENVHGGLRDTNPDGSVVRTEPLINSNDGSVIANAGSAVVTPGSLTDVSDDGSSTTSTTGTTTTESGETGASTTNDTDTSTESTKITKERDEPADEPADDVGFGAEST